jgi:hypothetical protein
MSVRSEFRLRQRARSCETPSSNRPRVDRLDRPHRPASRRDPELLSVTRAAEFLGRSACRTWGECPSTPQAADTEDKVRMRSECRANRSTAAVCGDQDFRGIRHSGKITYCEPALQYLTISFIVVICRHGSPRFSRSQEHDRSPGLRSSSNAFGDRTECKPVGMPRGNERSRTGVSPGNDLGASWNASNRLSEVEITLTNHERKLVSRVRKRHAKTRVKLVVLIAENLGLAVDDQSVHDEVEHACRAWERRPNRSRGRRFSIFSGYARTCSPPRRKFYEQRGTEKSKMTIHLSTARQRARLQWMRRSGLC